MDIPSSSPSANAAPPAEPPVPPAHCDVLVLGAGGGGYPGTFFLARSGRRVVMVDPYGNLGGNCLAEGCVPSKAVRAAASLREQAGRLARFGLEAPLPRVDWRAVLAHKDGVQNTRYAQHLREIRESGVTFVAGRGEILDDGRARLTGTDGRTHEIRYGALVLATGAAPSRLPIPGAEHALTSHDLFRLGADLPRPDRLVIIGGGYIGAETASILSALGTTCTILEYAPQLLPGFDAELAHFLEEALAPRVRLELGAEVLAIEKGPEGLAVHYRQAGREDRIAGDAVLMATGRRPVLPEGVERLGLATAHGAVLVDEALRTSHPRVWAPGDVNGRSMLFHSAVRQSLVAAHTIVAGGQTVDRMRFDAVPMTVFTEPELAHVGLTEAEAAGRLGADGVRVGRYDYAEDSRAQIHGLTRGFIKLVFARRDGRLLGAQIAGMDAAQLVAPLALALECGLDAAALAATSFPHPMLSEGLAKAARTVRP